MQQFGVVFTLVVEVQSEENAFEGILRLSCVCSSLMIFCLQQTQQRGSPGGRSAGRASRDRDSKTRERFA